MLEFLRDSVHLPDKKNTLEDFIWTVLSSREVVASLRVYALYDLLLSRQMRWLSGKGATLPGFSTYKMGEVFDGVTALRRRSSPSQRTATYSSSRTQTSSPASPPSSRSSGRGATRSFTKRSRRFRTTRAP